MSRGSVTVEHIISPKNAMSLLGFDPGTISTIRAKGYIHHWLVLLWSEYYIPI